MEVLRIINGFISLVSLEGGIPQTFPTSPAAPTPLHRPWTHLSPPYIPTHLTKHRRRSSSTLFINNVRYLHIIQQWRQNKLEVRRTAHRFFNIESAGTRRPCDHLFANLKGRVSKNYVSQSRADSPFLRRWSVEEGVMKISSKFTTKQVSLKNS